MKVTIDLPEEVLRRAKSEAALRGRKLRELFLDGILRVLNEPEPPTLGQAKRSGRPLPVIVPRTGVPLAAVSPEAIRQMEDEARDDRSA